MILESTSLFLNRDQAAQQLAEKLLSYENKDVIIAAVSKGAWPIANHIAKRLEADFTFVPCEMIKDPADPLKTIGVVSFDYTIINNACRDIPQDYIYRQAQMLQANLKSRYRNFYRTMATRFQDRVVILVDDLTNISYEILACLKTIRKQQPEKIIVAVPAITENAAHEIAKEAEALIFIHVISEDSIKTLMMTLIAQILNKNLN